MKEILSKRHYRRSFYTIVLLALLLFAVVRYAALPFFDPALDVGWAAGMGEFLERLIASLVVTVFIGSFVFWVTPDEVERSAIEVVEPREIRQLLESAMPRTRRWRFRGNCGRYMRSKTLPALAAAARLASTTRDVTILLLDPTSERAVNIYADYRKSLRSAQGAHEWTPERVVSEVYATALHAFVARARQPLLNVSIGVLDQFSPFRLDMSDDYVVLTKEDRSAPAVKCAKDSYFYDSFLEELVLHERQSKIVGLPSTVPDLNAMSVEQAEALLTRAGIFPPCVPVDLAQVLAVARRNDNPYA